MYPLVSIIIPTKNSEKTVEPTLRSIRSQTYPNIEVIVVDNNSTDRTLSLVKEVHPEVKILSSGPERSSQRNDGASVAKGKYLYFVDSDFYLSREVVSEAAKGCEGGYNAAVIHNTSYPLVSFWARVRKLERDSYYLDQGHVASRFMRRDLFFRVGGFDPAIVAGEDYDLHLRLKMASARFFWCKSVEYHLGEPKELREVVSKHVYYGKYILGYAKREFAIRFWQLSPFRRSYVRNWRGFFKDPRLLVGFVIYQYVRYCSTLAGMFSSFVSPVELVRGLSVPRMAEGERSGLLGMVSVVVVTRNRPEEFKRCLESLQPVRTEVELIVVDDHSEVPYDHNLSGVKKLVRNPRRMFLNASRNVGASIATRPFVLFVDDDNEIKGECVSLLAKVLDSFQHVGVASPLILTKDGRVWFAGGWISPVSGLAVFNYRNLRPESLPRRLMETRLFHSSFMIRRELLSRLGGFDSRDFPMYLGEADLSERISRLAYRIVVDPAARVIHHIESGRMKGVLRNIHITEPARAYFVGRNRILYMRRNRSRLVFLVFLLVFQPVIAAIHILTIMSGSGSSKWTRLAGPYLRGLVDGIAGRPTLGSRVLNGAR
ncbi:MAG: glycosyltransferase [Nitrososphaerales archaeon]|nr:glycosyltransferase [Nitrososphaerales archaeon]